MEIKCDEWICANNGGGYCKLGSSDSEYATLIIEGGECMSFELKEGAEDA